MAANTAPIYTISPHVEWGSEDGNGGAAGPLKTANTAKDGTGTVLTVFTADVTNGSYIQEIRARAAGTNVASVLRVFLNNGSTNATIANNILIAELPLPATTLTEVAALSDYTIQLQRAIPAGYKLNVTLGTTVAAGYFVSCFGGNY
jgi:hypothetical protein